MIFKNDSYEAIMELEKQRTANYGLDFYEEDFEEAEYEEDY